MIKLVKFEDKEFPESLRKIDDAPKKFWANGNISLLNSRGIAIVGARHCTQYGKKWCENFTKGLLQYDLTIISGMAIGIDTVAHETAIKYKGKTIAILPCGFNNIYPKINNELYDKILKSGGLVISEYPPDEIVKKEKFLRRNRIVSGLSIATLIVEATYRSGTSVTARFAKKQKKLVFCIPGSLDNSKSLGTNRLIQKGAKLVTCVDDIVDDCKLREQVDINMVEERKRKIEKIDKKEIEFTKGERKEQEKDICKFEKPEIVPKEYRDIYTLIIEKPMRINEIAKTLKIPISEAMVKTTMLELDGKIERDVGDVFFKTKKVSENFNKI